MVTTKSPFFIRKYLKIGRRQKFAQNYSMKQGEISYKFLPPLKNLYIFFKKWPLFYFLNYIFQRFGKFDFFSSEILCNVTLWVHESGGGSSIKAHQAILSACSPWFEKILSQNQHPHPIIILKDVRYHDLKNIIR